MSPLHFIGRCIISAAWRLSFVHSYAHFAPALPDIRPFISTLPSMDFLQTLPFADGKYESCPKITEPETFNVAKDGRLVTLVPAYSAGDLPQTLLHVLFDQFNRVVDEGRTYPFHERMLYKEFKEYLFEGMAAILLDGDFTNTKMTEDADWRNLYLGYFYIKPNYKGRCSHVCNAGFVVNDQKRGLGIGKELGRMYLEWAPRLGYVYSVFNLVFETNTASKRIWDSLGFEQIGYVKNVAVLKGEDRLVGAYIYGKDLVKSDRDAKI